MAEVKNSFLKSKMNQDLDDRLIPNGEYRYANNISVGKSESDDIGALKNVLGNELLTGTDNSEFLPGTNMPNPNYIPGLECIGIFMDNQNNRMFQFLTNYTDPNPNQITFPEDAPFTEGITEWKMKIAMYTFEGNSAPYVTLVDGLFLNLAKNKQFKITGVNLVEGLLFWTDNRNQPRKINVSNALTNINYYTTEEQISVAKYAPIAPITLYKKVTTKADSDSSGNILEVVDAVGIVPGMTLVTEDISGSDFCTVVDVTENIVTFYENYPGTITEGTDLTFLISTMSDKSQVPSWPGDPAFLEDKYVRFSYRFKYDDNEYSLMAPFTQIAYIPKQKGYFINGNETDAYRSTVINWFENNINNIELIVPFPDKIGNLANSYKIIEIDILYKESDSTAIKVFETVPLSFINTTANANNNYYIQQYQSQKPYKTLSEDQTVRVYDKVPVRARAQESAGNRIIYGNYYDKYTSLASINYNIAVQPKSTSRTNFIEYPNHTLKKNRNYQVGFVIADKFGRQSPVILSSGDLPGLDLGLAGYAKGSTVYSSYENSILFDDVRTWFGDALILYLNSPINQQKDIPTGQPGLYAIPTSNFGFAITDFAVVGPKEYAFTMDLDVLSSQFIPEVGNILRGKYVDYVKVLESYPVYQIPGDNTSPIVSVTIKTSDDINDIYKYVDQGFDVPDIKFSYKYNPIGWYSYKVVVKQQEQDYYNVYLPGMLNGYPKGQTSGSQVVYNTAGLASLENGINTTQFPVSETGNTSHIVLINDNINKVPRDLSEVGPDQKQYRSSIQLYGRVENTKDNITIIGDDPEYSAKVIIIKYTIVPLPDPNAKNNDWALINPGDGIQCVEANTPVNNTSPGLGGTIPNPYRWLGDTVVVSNEVVGNAGIITISSPNWVLEAGGTNPDYKTFIITRAENKQYFPTRKADTVISIATADEFNFLDSSEDNLSGTAGLNFYQLQTKPLIGRVSTVNQIGVTAKDMIPFLSVYETRAEQSLLELFWETATTGLISDLNTDVLTGFNGPVGFDNVNYTHFEWQDPNGFGDVKGEANSPYITDEFYVVDQTDTPIPFPTVTLESVYNNEILPVNRTSDFELETILPTSPGDITQFRLKIKPPPTGSPFVFNHTAGDKESYVFTFNVTDTSDPDPTQATLTFSGRLGNKAPIITTTTDNYSITQTPGIVVDLQANNGSFSLSNSDLYWSIVSGNNAGYFQINATSGVLEMIEPLVPLGTYILKIKVQDAVNTSDGEVLEPINTNFGTQYDEIELIINVGDAGVSEWLRPNYTSAVLVGSGSCGASGTGNSFGTWWSAAYIGPNPSPSDSDLPAINGVYQSIPYYETGSNRNVEAKNALDYNPSVPDLLPQGLTQGEYRFSVKLDVYAPAICSVDPDQQFTGNANSKGEAQIFLYKRKWNPNAPLQWEMVRNENNFGVASQILGVPPYKIGPLTVSTFENEGMIYQGATKSLTTSFTIESADTVDERYEWAVVVRLYGEYQSGFSEKGQAVTIYGNDANFSYPTTTFPFLPAVTNEYEYYTGVEEISPDPMIPGYTSGVPYETQDATKGLSYFSANNQIALGQINAGNQVVNITLVNVNNQIAKGLRSLASSGGPGRVVDVNPNDPAQITLQLDFIPSSTVNLAGGNLQVNTGGDPTILGKLYVNTEEGTEVRRFYTDPGLIYPWTPPVAGKFYNFITVKNYNPQNLVFPPISGAIQGEPLYTNFPIYCARINANGEVIEQINSIPNVQTAWEGANAVSNARIENTNYSYNVLYTETPVPPIP
jgi:hypothetical protein